MRRGSSAVLLLISGLSLLPESAHAEPGPDFRAALSGHWIGTLEYRDYGNNRRVTLPTQLDIVAGGDTSLDFRYVYDDGPGKTVRETSHVTIDPALHRYTVAGDDERDVYRIVERSGFADDDVASRMLLSGTGKENGHPVKIRTSIVRYGNDLSIVRESQLPGEPFKFRHQYRFTRSAAAVQ